MIGRRTLARSLVRPVAAAIVLASTNGVPFATELTGEPINWANRVMLSVGEPETCCPPTAKRQYEP